MVRKPVGGVSHPQPESRSKKHRTVTSVLIVRFCSTTPEMKARGHAVQIQHRNRDSVWWLQIYCMIHSGGWSQNWNQNDDFTVFTQATILTTRRFPFKGKGLVYTLPWHRGALKCHGLVGGTGGRYGRNKYREDDCCVGGIRKNVQPLKKSTSRSFSATTLSRHATQKVVPNGQNQRENAP